VAHSICIMLILTKYNGFLVISSIDGLFAQRGISKKLTAV